MLGLRWDAVDFEAGTLTIRHIVTGTNLEGKHVLVEADRAKTKSSLLLKQGVPIKQIQEWLSRSDISTTANIYAHLDSQSKQLSAATMEKALPLPESGVARRW